MAGVVEKTVSFHFVLCIVGLWEFLLRGTIPCSFTSKWLTSSPSFWWPKWASSWGSDITQVWVAGRTEDHFLSSFFLCYWFSGWPWQVISHGPRPLENGRVPQMNFGNFLAVTLSYMILTPKWLVTTRAPLANSGFLWGKKCNQMRLAEGIAPSGHLFLTFLKNGADDHLHRYLWFSNGNPHTQSQTHTVTSRAGCGTRSPLINSFDSHLDSCAFSEMSHALSGKMEPGGRKVKLSLYFTSYQSEFC